MLVGGAQNQEHYYHAFNDELACKQHTGQRTRKKAYKEWTNINGFYCTIFRIWSFFFRVFPLHPTLQLFFVVKSSTLATLNRTSIVKPYSRIILFWFYCFYCSFFVLFFRRLLLPFCLFYVLLSRERDTSFVGSFYLCLFQPLFSQFDFCCCCCVAGVLVGVIQFLLDSYKPHINVRFRLNAFDGTLSQASKEEKNKNTKHSIEICMKSVSLRRKYALMWYSVNFTLLLFLFYHPHPPS